MRLARPAAILVLGCVPALAACGAVTGTSASPPATSAAALAGTGAAQPASPHPARSLAPSPRAPHSAAGRS